MGGRGRAGRPAPATGQARTTNPSRQNPDPTDPAEPTLHGPGTPTDPGRQNPRAADPGDPGDPGDPALHGPGTAAQQLDQVLSGTRPAPTNPTDLAELIKAASDGTQIYRLAQLVGTTAFFEAKNTTKGPNPAPRPAAGHVADQVQDAYWRLADEAGDWVNLTQIRQALPDLHHEQVSDVIKAMNRHRDIHLVPETYQAGLTPADRANAVRLGGRDMHLIKFDRRAGWTEGGPDFDQPTWTHTHGTGQPDTDQGNL